jgi:hypothetical protein
MLTFPTHCAKCGQPFTINHECSRPVGRPRKYANDAERQAAYLARKGARLVSLTLPDDVAEALDEYVERQAMDGAGLTKSEVIAKLIRQLS